MATLVNDSILKNDAAGPVPVSGGLGTDSYYNHSFFQVYFFNFSLDNR
jgi:hypothetical protein